MRNQQDNYQFLTEAPVHKVIGKMAIPTIISMLITSLYNLVDTFFVGKLNTQSTAAVGVVFSLMFFVQAIAFFLGNGSGNYISRELGAQRHHNARQMASTALGYAMILSVTLTILGFIFLTPIARELGSTPTILPYTEDYLSYSLIGVPFLVSSLCINNQMRFQGYAVYGMVGMVSGTLLNCILNPLFIFVFDMGIKGSALATVVGEIVSFFILLAMSKKKGIIHYSPKNFSHSMIFIKEIIAGGTPSLSRQGLASIATIALNVSASQYGDAAIAAMSIVNRIMMFIFSMIIGMGQGYQPMCGFCFGAKRYERVKEGFWFCVKVGTIFLIFWVILLYGFSKEAIELFRSDPAVISIGTRALRYQLIVFPFYAYLLMANMMMQTCRKTIRANILAAARQGIFFIPIILLLPKVWGLTGVEAAQALSDAISLLITIPLVYWAFNEMKTES